MYQLTRYLYELSEVKGNLLLALLNKNKEQTLFWAFEYYYSGYIYETINFIILIYYDFFYVLNPSFEKYFFVKLKKISLENENEELALFIQLMLNNLIHRPYTLDIFMLRNMGLQFDVDFDEIENINEEIISLLLEHDNYIYLATIIMQCHKFNDINELGLLHSMIIDIMGNHVKINKTAKMKETNSLFEKCYKDDFILKRTILLSRIVYYYSLVNNIKTHRSIYIENNIEQQIKDLYQYKTKYPTSLIFDAKYASNEQYFIGIFHLERFKENINFKQNYLTNWEYYAYNTPYWTNIFLLYDAFKNEKIKKIIFNNSDIEDQFYEEINYFPDEESIEIQNKSIGYIEKNSNLNNFYNNFGNNNIIRFNEQDLAELDLIKL